MRKTLFSLALLILLLFALSGKNSDDLKNTNTTIVACIKENPTVAEVFGFVDGAVET